MSDEQMRVNEQSAALLDTVRSWIDEGRIDVKRCRVNSAERVLKLTWRSHASGLPVEETT